jgi:hypothetical protein
VPDWAAGRWCDVFEIRDLRIQRCFIDLDPDYAGKDTERYPLAGRAQRRAGERLTRVGRDGSRRPTALAGQGAIAAEGAAHDAERALEHRCAIVSPPRDGELHLGGPRPEWPVHRAVDRHVANRVGHE